MVDKGYLFDQGMNNLLSLLRQERSIKTDAT
jgi:hypothetical protein